VVTGALEIVRAKKGIGSGLEAALVLYLEEPVEASFFLDPDLAEITITSFAEIKVGKAPRASLDLADLRDLNFGEGEQVLWANGAFSLTDVPGATVIVYPAPGEKCARCWRVLEEVVHHPDTHLCNRCTDAVQSLGPK
jgi:isoleucyl-tRNA synthetase